MTTETSAGAHGTADEGEPQAPEKNREPTVPRRLYSITEICDTLGRSRATVWRLIADGTLSVVRLGAATSVTAESLERLIREGSPTVAGRGRRPRPPPRRRTPETAQSAGAAAGTGAA